MVFEMVDDGTPTITSRSFTCDVDGDIMKLHVGTMNGSERNLVSSLMKQESRDPNT
jgi:hypothetical protein